ncbi:kunitz-like toxin PcKuz3, partial [Saccoglossus kowalevskii]
WVPCEKPLLSSNGFPFNCVYQGCSTGYSCVANSDNYGVCCPGDCCLPVNPGVPCEFKLLPRWYFDYQLNECIQFAYSGCGGNNNNLVTEEACRRHC